MSFNHDIDLSITKKYHEHNTVLSLPSEIILSILQWLNRSDIRNCRLVSQEFYHITIPYLFRELTFRNLVPRDSPQHRLLDRLTSTPSFLQYTRYISIFLNLYRPHSDGLCPANTVSLPIEKICDIIRDSKNLKSVSINITNPETYSVASLHSNNREAHGRFRRKQGLETGGNPRPYLGRNQETDAICKEITNRNLIPEQFSIE